MQKGKKVGKLGYQLISMELIDRPEEGDRVEALPEEIAELRNSISQRGLLSPIQVNREGSRYRIVFGDRRFQAVQGLKWEKIQATVVELSNIEVLINRTTENVQRKNLSPIEEGLSLKRLIDEGGLDYGEVGKQMGMSPGTVKRRISTLRMPDSFQVALHSGKVSLSVAEELWSCADTTHRDYLLELAVEHGITSAIARQWVQDFRKSQTIEKEVTGGGGNGLEPMESAPIYRACDLCRDPVELKELKELRTCPNCLGAILQGMKGGG